MSMDDLTLVDRVVENNDEHAYAELVKRYQSQLRYSLRQLSGWNEALADDIAQEAFLKAYKSLRQYRKEAKFFTWLYRIAYNCYAEHYRKHRPEDSLNDAIIKDIVYEPTAKMDLHRDFARVLQNFPPQQRMALHLHYHRGLTHQEISDIMSCPLGTVKSHILRGTDKLRNQLSSWKAGD